MGYKCRIGDIWQLDYNTKAAGRGLPLVFDDYGFIFV